MAADTLVEFDQYGFGLLHEAIQIAVNVSIASGFLSGKYRSEKDLTNSSRAGYVKKYLNARGFRILEAIDELAKTYNTTPTQISLAWLIQRQSITAPIVSATKLEQLNEIIKAVNLKLDSASMELLDRASAYDSDE
ncbi:aldo/keto reductase [Scytonema sp. UIC 10036]|uniref:aldo/keto reductase n=1 Tax=Scytonema sp. UIC 10036 TaxID=2304196 RepID=UPI001FAB2F69|nr:aldo/keto reductase [Scytonema sp. UIC 10036]